MQWCECACIQPPSAALRDPSLSFVVTHGQPPRPHHSSVLFVVFKGRYVNGARVGQFNLGEGPPQYSTRPKVHILAPLQHEYRTLITFSTALLLTKPGDVNVIAVEVRRHCTPGLGHQPFPTWSHRSPFLPVQ